MKDSYLVEVTFINRSANRPADTTHLADALTRELPKLNDAGDICQHDWSFTLIVREDRWNVAVPTPRYVPWQDVDRTVRQAVAEVFNLMVPIRPARCATLQEHS